MIMVVFMVIPDMTPVTRVWVVIEMPYKYFQNGLAALTHVLDPFSFTLVEFTPDLIHHIVCGAFSRIAPFFLATWTFISRQRVTFQIFYFFIIF